MSIEESDIYGWQRAEVLANRRLMFVLWAVKTLFCTSTADFLHHYKITEPELHVALNRLTVQGFLQRDGENYVLTQLGEETASYLGTLSESQFAHPERISAEVDTRFEDTAPLALARAALDTDATPLATLPMALPVFDATIAQRFWAQRPQDKDTPEATLVELPFIQQAVGLGWHYLAGDISVPEVTHRKTFREVLLEQHLRETLPEINRDEQTGALWLDESRIELAITDLRRFFTSYPGGLLETNKQATNLLLGGTIVPGTQALHQGTLQRIRYIDFTHPERNHFLLINQFRVDRASSRYVVPDIVLFVNGIPLVVVECKSPNLTNPVEEGITQLLRYSGQQSATQEDSEAVPELFYFNQVLISTCFFRACSAVLGASYESFQEWRDPYPATRDELVAEVQSEQPSSQHTLVRGMLAPSNLLDLLYNFTLFVSRDNKSVKLIARYHQFRAVCKAVNRLLEKQTRQQHGEDDQRGGIIWHTQGSGKSFTMVFLVRKMRVTPRLIDFKVVFVTDRSDLQKQLRATLHNTEEPIETANKIADLETKLQPEGHKLVFAMIQKYQARGNRNY